MTILNAKQRTLLGSKTNRLRKDGLIPAVLYGPGIESINLSLDYKEFEKLYAQAGESSMIELKVESEDSPRNILIHDIASHPVDGRIIHVDLRQVKMDEKIKAVIPLEFIGESGAIKNLSGILIKNIHEVEVEAFPKDLPHKIDVDISSLETFEDSVKIQNVVLPEGVKITADLSDVIVLVVPQEEEKVEEEKVEISEVKVETEEKKKEREKGEQEENKEKK